MTVKLGVIRREGDMEVIAALQTSVVNDGSVQNEELEESGEVVHGCIDDVQAQSALAG